MGTGLLSNLHICGNKEKNFYSIDREQTGINPENIETITNEITTYGIKGGSVTKLQNITVHYFTYGIYFNTASVYIHNIMCRYCIYGLSIGNDTKCTNIYGFDVQTLLQIRGAISSAVQVRGDSVKHLVNITGGNSIYLADLDADYCIGALLVLGDGKFFNNINGLLVQGIHGRHNTYYSYPSEASEQDIPTALDLTEQNLTLLPAIAVLNKTNFSNSKILYNTGAEYANPLDSNSNYKCPSDIMLCAGDESSV